MRINAADLAIIPHTLVDAMGEILERTTKRPVAMTWWRVACSSLLCPSGMRCLRMWS